MYRRLFIGSALIVIGILMTGGCERQSPPPLGGTVKASTAYVTHFGQPPTPQQGMCFARVGYLPLRSDPGKVRAMPFFLFRETGQLQQLLDRLVSGTIPLPPEDGLFNPFPQGTTVRVGAEEGGTVTLHLTFAGPLPPERERSAMAATLTETASQFEGISRVIILGNGQPFPGAPTEGFRHDPEHVAAVGPPVLLMIVGSWENGQDHPEEIHANFDRPVTIGTFRLGTADGQQLDGEYFQSVFNMAVVIHPANPAAFHEGEILHATWDVTDNLGRRGQGQGPFPLQRHDHDIAERPGK